MNYKTEVVECRRTGELVFPADNVDSDEGESDPPDCLRNAMFSIKRGKHLRKSLSLIKHELTDAEKQNVSCKAVMECNVLQYILPFCSIESDIDLLVDSISIIVYISIIEQPIDSPFQNKKFILNLIDIIRNDINSQITANILIIIHNLLCDENIGCNIHEILNEINIIDFMMNYNLLNVKYINLRYSGSLLSQILQLNSEEEIIKIQNVFNFIIEILKSSNDSEIHSCFLESLSILLVYPEFYQMDSDNNIPNILLNSLKFYHDESIIFVFKSIYSLCSYGYFNPEFLSSDFFHICNHLFMTTHERIINNILKTLELFIPLYYQELWDENVISCIIYLLKNGSCTIRLNCTGFILTFLNYATCEQINSINDDNGFELIFDSIGSFSIKGISYSLQILSNLLSKGFDITQFNSLRTFLEELLTDVNPELSNLACHYYSLFFGNT